MNASDMKKFRSTIATKKFALDASSFRSGLRRLSPNNETYWVSGDSGDRIEKTWSFKYDAFGRQVEVKQTAGTSVRTVTKSYDGGVARGISPFKCVPLAKVRRGRVGSTLSWSSNFQPV